MYLYEFSVTHKGWYQGAPSPFSLAPLPLILKFMLQNTVLQQQSNITDQTSCAPDALPHPWGKHCELAHPPIQNWDTISAGNR